MCRIFINMARWLVLLSVLFLLSGSSAHPHTRLATHSRPKLTVRSQTDKASSSPGNTTITNSDPASLVNVFIGTTNGGHVFPGLLLQRIFVICWFLRRCHSSAWNGESWTRHWFPRKCKVIRFLSFFMRPQVSCIIQQAGYDANPIFNAIGFSQLHDSGTGGVRILGAAKYYTYLQANIFWRTYHYPTLSSGLCLNATHSRPATHPYFSERRYGKSFLMVTNYTHVVVVC